MVPVDPSRRRRIGLIVNPVAGMGGAVGLKGTDDVLERARALGAVPVSSERARRALAKLTPDSSLITCPGSMGESAAVAAGLVPLVLGERPGGVTTAAETRRAAAALLAHGVDLLLFAGGDGTARDIAAVVGTGLPVLGIPTGVKMHSGVFATGPEAAGQLVNLFLGDASRLVRLREAEVLDVDEEALRAGRVSVRLYGYVLVPRERTLLQNAKASRAMDGDTVLEAACHQVASELEPGVLHLFGPGTTTQRILRAMGLAGSLLGIDAVRDGQLVGADLAQADILRLLADGPARIILGVTGGQGFLLGRGNQQLGPEAIGRVGMDRLLIVADAAKLAALEPCRLLVDTGEPKLDRRLAGWVRVRTGPAQSTIMRVDPA